MGRSSSDVYQIGRAYKFKGVYYRAIKQDFKGTVHFKPDFPSFTLPDEEFRTKVKQIKTMPMLYKKQRHRLLRF